MWRKSCLETSRLPCSQPTGEADGVEDTRPERSVAAIFERARAWKADVEPEETGAPEERQTRTRVEGTSPERAASSRLLSDEQFQETSPASALSDKDLLASLLACRRSCLAGRNRKSSKVQSWHGESPKKEARLVYFYGYDYDYYYYY